MNRKKVYVSPHVKTVMTETSYIALSDPFGGDMSGGEAGAKGAVWEDNPSEEFDDYSVWDHE